MDFMIVTQFCKMCGRSRKLEDGKWSEWKLRILLPKEHIMPVRCFSCDDAMFKEHERLMRELEGGG